MGLTLAILKRRTEQGSLETVTKRIIALFLLFHFRRNEQRLPSLPMRSGSRRTTRLLSDQHEFVVNVTFLGASDGTFCGRGSLGTL